MHLVLSAGCGPPARWASLHLTQYSLLMQHPCIYLHYTTDLEAVLCPAQYVDYVGSWGPAIVGHAHPEVTEALTEQIKKVWHCAQHWRQCMQNLVQVSSLALFTCLHLIVHWLLGGR